MSLNEPLCFCDVKKRGANMIICHSMKFILVRPKKVASSSVYAAILPHLQIGDRAICPPFDVEVQPGVMAPDDKSNWPWVVRTHSPISRFLRAYGDKFLSYRIVTMARNPWDRAVSEFYWKFRESGIRSKSFDEQQHLFNRYIKHMSSLSLFRSVVDRLEGRTRLSVFDQSDMCIVKGEFVADDVIFYERLEDGLIQFGKAVGLGLNLPKKREKSGHRLPSSKNWGDIYTPEAKKAVEVVCHREIELFGYDFEGVNAPVYKRRQTVSG